MGKLKFDISHTLPRAEARQRVEKLLSYWATKYGVTSQWSGDGAKLSGKVLGIQLAADLEVREGKVDGEATDPGFLFRDKARKYLTEKFTHYLDPATPLDKLA
ncbi:MAG TPA: polyhydroxyalkanoic acid system family protein [Myxococcales bacterium]|nr:polyhydroxyalkanoic acid system family protein [Myxococcales bacterium]